jgi:hypothetical protein
MKETNSAVDGQIAIPNKDLMPTTLKLGPTFLT